MPCSLCKMVKITAEDITMWVLIVATLGVIIWKMFGSFSDLAVIITVGLFIIGMISALGKRTYQIDKETSNGFLMVKHDMDNLRKDINHKQDISHHQISNRLDKIESLIKRKKK